MAHPLEQKISQVRSAGPPAAGSLCAGLDGRCRHGRGGSVGLADYLIRFQDRGIRLMCSLSVLAVAAWAGYRFWFLSFRQRLADVAIAKRIERRFPALADRLASTIEFLKQSEADVQAGSAALRRAVILETTADAEGLDFAQVFERQPTRRALTVAGAGRLRGVAGGAARARKRRDRAGPAGAPVRRRRLAADLQRRSFAIRPRDWRRARLSKSSWCRTHEHRLPDEVRIHYRYETDASADEAEAEPMHLLNGVMVARKDSVTRPFWYRAEGGDDQSMPWIRLEVVEPPRLESLEVTLHPPAYSGLPVEASEKSIQRCAARASSCRARRPRNCASVTIHQESGDELAAELSADAYGFSLAADAAEPFVIDKSGPYWIVLEDGEGLTGGADDRWDIRAIADMAPTRDDRAAGGQRVSSRRRATCRLRIVVKDDLAIHDIGLHFSRSDRTDVEDLTVPLYQGSEQVDAAGGERTAWRAATWAKAARSSIAGRWPSWASSRGTQITFWATASDYLPQTGKSTVRRLSIITPQELEERLAQRQTLIFGELQRVLKLQQDARAQTRSLEIQMEQVGQLDQAGRRSRPVGRIESTAGRPHADQPDRRHSGADRRFSGRPGKQSRRQSRHRAAHDGDVGRARPAGARALGHDRARADQRDQGGPGRSAAAIRPTTRQPRPSDPLVEPSR